LRCSLLQFFGATLLCGGDLLGRIGCRFGHCTDWRQDAREVDEKAEEDTQHQAGQETSDQHAAGRLGRRFRLPGFRLPGFADLSEVMCHMMFVVLSIAILSCGALSRNSVDSTTPGRYRA